MKMNKAVLARVGKMRERKGFKTVDTKSLFYKVCKWLYAIVFLWYIAVPSILALSWWVFPDDYGAYTSLFHKIFLTVVVFGTFAAGIVLLKRRHEVGAVLNLVFIVAGLYELKYYMHRFKQFDIDDGYMMVFGEKILHDYIWRHFVPAFLMLLLGAIICGIYMRERLLLKRDYNKVLDALYIANKDKLTSGSEEEWDALLASLEDSDIERELDKYHTQQYLKRKADSMAKEEEKLKDSEKE